MAYIIPLLYQKQPSILANHFPTDHANINVSLACIWVTVMKPKWGQHSLSLSFHTKSAGQITRELTQAPPWAQQTTVSGAEPRPSTCKASQGIPGQGAEWETNIGAHCNSMFVRWGNSPESKSPRMFWKSWGLSEATQSGGSWISAFNMPPRLPHPFLPCQHQSFWVSCLL